MRNTAFSSGLLFLAEPTGSITLFNHSFLWRKTYKANGRTLPR